MMPRLVTITLEEFLARHGGYRPGAGRRAEYGIRQKPASIMLGEEHYAFLASYTDTHNVSDAVRLLCEKYARTPLRPQRVKPSVGGKERIWTSVTLPDDLKEFLSELGKGSFVSGIRLLIELERTSLTKT